MSELSRETDDHPATAIDWPDVWAAHGRWLRTVVLARMGNAATVDDVMQDVAAAAAAGGHRLRDRSKLAAWLYRLAVTTALQHRRRLGRQRRLTERYALRWRPTESDSRQPDPLDWLLADEQRRLVRMALKNLNRRDAEILLLKYTENWSYRQLAEHLGTTASAVESRLHRARGRLRSALAALDPSFVQSEK